jgi:pilus assembly protein CpaE
VLGTVNDVALFRDLLSAGASDYLVKPSTRDALAAILEKTSAPLGTTPDGLGQVIVFAGSRGGVGTTTAAVSCAWLMAPNAVNGWHSSILICISGLSL